jgi:RNA polymerase sigma factor (sigma-70 family)
MKRASSEQSFELLYRRHAADVYRSTLAMLGCPADAEEVTQTTFLNAFRAIEKGERPRSAGAWLNAIALNLCRQRFRQAARRPSQVPLAEDIADVVPDDEAPTMDDLTRALKHLPFNQRAALVLREFEGLAPREIATRLEVSVSAVETLLFRARRSLREQLEGNLTCQDAERAISLQLDGLLARSERGALRAHLRECPECARLARGVRAQSSAMKSLALLPLPASLAWASHQGPGAAVAAGYGGGTAAVGSLAAKLVAGALATTALVGAGRQVLIHPPWRSGHVHAKRVLGTPRRSSLAAGRSGVAAPARGVVSLDRLGVARAPVSVTGLGVLTGKQRRAASAPSTRHVKPSHQATKAPKALKAKPPKAQPTKTKSPKAAHTQKSQHGPTKQRPTAAKPVKSPKIKPGVPTVPLP